MDDLTPLPEWRQRLARLRAWWKRSKSRRAQAAKTFISMVKTALTFAITVLGAILISYGAYLIYAPMGYLAGGLMCWLVLWSYEKDRGGSR